MPNGVKCNENVIWVSVLRLHKSVIRHVLYIHVVDINGCHQVPALGMKCEFNYILPKFITDYIRQAQVVNIDNLKTNKSVYEILINMKS